MQNETLFSIIQLTFLSIKKVFAKPLLLISYIIIISAFIGIIYIGSDLSGLTKSYDKGSDLAVMTVILLWYLVFIAILALAYVSSLVVIKNNNSFNQDLSDLWSYIINPGYFLKTMFFSFRRSMKFVVAFIPVLILFILSHPLFFLFTVIAGGDGPRGGALPFVSTLCVIVFITVFYRHVRGMLIVPYGIIVGNSYKDSSNESAKSMKGSECVFFCILILFFAIHICYGVAVILDPDYMVQPYEFDKPKVPLYENYSLMVGILLCSTFFLIYSTMINLLYFKRRTTK
jgi:hypothetical protein